MVIPLVAAVLTVLIAFTSIAIDLGFQRVVRRDMQALADVMALDLSRHLDGRTKLAIRTDPVFLQAKDASEARNLPGLTGTGVTTTFDLGTVDASTGVFTSGADGDRPNAVLVTAVGTLDWFFRPGSTSVTRRAVAGIDPLACYTVGSFALGVNSSNSAMLNAFLGDALNIGVLGYNGLATSQITLFDLATQLNVGTIDQLMATNIGMADFALLVADVLRNQNPPQTANAIILESAAAQMGTTQVSIGDIISAGPGDDAALDAFVNVLDLFGTGAFVANGTNAVALPNIGLTVPGLAQGTGSLSIVERPAIGCGNAGDPLSATSTRQVNLDLVISGNVNLGILGLPLAGVQATLALDTAVGNAIIQRILCGTPQELDVGVVTALLATSLQVRTTVLGLVITSTVATTAPASQSVASFVIPPDQFGVAEETGTGTVGLSGAAVTTTTSGGLGLLLNHLTNSVLTAITSRIVNPLITQLDTLLLGPLTDLLGLNVAGADVAALDIFCTSPDLLV